MTRRLARFRTGTIPDRPGGSESWQRVPGPSNVIRAVPALVMAWVVTFAAETRALDLAASEDGDAVSLPPVVVTGTRTPMPLEDVPADVTVLSRRDLEQSGALTLDDALRQLPDFNTFRRSSSLVTPPAEDPEAQGVTLRGIGPGGASRALVLLDGVPINDAFGGWLYWGEVPLDSIDRIEVTRGGFSSLWGNFALGGVINIITRPAEPGVLQVATSGGNRSTTRDALSYAAAAGPVRMDVRGDVLHSGGWNIVTPSQRGPIDQDVNLDNHNVAGRLDYSFGNHGLLFARAAYYDEGRGNGTPFRDSDASRISLVGGGRVDALGGHFDATVFSHVSRMRQTFSDANVARTAETPTQIQRIPARDIGGSLTWSRPLFTHDLLTLGSDVRLVSGRSRDAFFDAAGHGIDDRRTSRGQQQFVGVFAQEVFTPIERLEAALGIRVDSYVNFDGRMIDAPAAGPTTTVHFRDRRGMPVSPKLGLRYDLGSGFALRGSGYRAFRAPTLAELYRRSSVEDLVLIENPRLRPEFLDGGEVGVDYLSPGRVEVHVTGYWNNIRDAISAITTAFDPVTGEDSQRSRVNLDLARVRGFETEATYHVTRPLAVFGRYIYSEALILDAPDPDLEGKRLTQVPEHAGVVGIRYADPRLFTALVQTRIESRKFEDPDNVDTLGGYYTIDASISRALPSAGVFHGGRVFVAVQNLLDRDYEVDKGGGITKIGTPLLVEAGVQLRF
jgi:outer membrane cobalamin receptor